MKIIALIGSSKFKDKFAEIGRLEELKGNLPICMTWFAHSEGIDVSESERAILRTVDRSRIDIAHEVFVINVGGYVGEDTQAEIDYALSKSKPISYLENDLYIMYTNWQEQTRERHIIPQMMWFGSTQWHQENQWLIKCIDLEDGKIKDFALLGFKGNDGSIQNAL